MHCQKGDSNGTKIISTHGILNKVRDHINYCNIDGVWKMLNYVELMSRHNHSKHCVDDVYNRRHDPISLEDVWVTNRRTTHQFTFLSSVVEVNAVNYWAQGKKETADPQPKIHFLLQPSNGHA